MDNAETVPPSRLALTDIYYVLFKHKWKIISFGLLGVLGAAGLYLKWPSTYLSEAKLLIRYVEETTAPTSVAGEARIKSLDQQGGGILNTEMEILRSFNVAREAAELVGPGKIIGSKDPDASVNAAAGIIQGNLLVGQAGRSSVISLLFKHEDPAVVQPVLNAVVERYLAKHQEIHQSSAYSDEILTRQTDQHRSRLLRTEEELRRLLDKAGVVSVEEAKTDYFRQISQLRQEILDAEAELAQRRAIVSQLTGQNLGDTPPADPELPVPPEIVDEYQKIDRGLQVTRQREQQLLLQYTEENLQVQGIRAQIEKMQNEKSLLERQYPRLAGVVRIDPTLGVPSNAIDPSAEEARIRGIETQIAVKNEQLATLNKEAANLRNLESEIIDLQRRQKLEENQYTYFYEKLEERRTDDALRALRNTNISVVQEPSPPGRNVGKLYKFMAVVLAGGFGLGLGLAFFIELYLDQTVKRPVEIEGKLGLPFFLSIPAIGRREARRLNGSRPLALTSGGANASQSPGPNGQSWDPATAEVVPWSVNNGMRTFFEALRNRLVYNFEIRNLTHNPKLVAVTGCRPKSGVSTVAAGLAAALSETGEGNVLLVNMNPGQHIPYYFHKGDLKCTLDEALEQQTRDEAHVRDNLYIASHTSEKDVSAILPKRFSGLVPRFKASDYDYIIFDLPPVSQISITPQLVRYMDMVLMVVEAEKNNRDAVKRAANLLTSSGANLGVVLNRTKSYLPEALDHELLGAG